MWLIEKERYLKLGGLLFVLLSLLFSAPEVFSQVDLDGDGAPEIILVDIQDDLRLHWRTVGLATGKESDLGVFGQANWNALISNWQTTAYTRSLIYRDDLGQIYLQLGEPRSEFILGLATTKSFVIAGSDINANGTADAVLVVERGGLLSWRFSFDPFTTEKSFSRILFGKKGDMPFFFRSRGGKDSLAVVTRNRIMYRGLSSRLTRFVNVLGIKVLAAPKRMRDSDGRDTLLFESKNDKGGLFVTSLKGRKKFEHHFSGKGELLVGDFGNSQDSFGYLRDTGELELVDGSLVNVGAGSFIIHNELLRSYDEDEVSGTPIPIAAPTIASASPLPTATFQPTGTIQPTYTPYPTFTATNTLTVTHTVTNTLTPTRTPTWTPSFTSTSTNTPTPTLTATVTNTSTSTPTLTSTPSFTNTPTPTSTPTPTRTLGSGFQYSVSSVADLGYSNNAAWGDYDNDGDLDIYVGNSGSGGYDVNSLYRNDGGGQFVNVAGSAGVDDSGSSAGVAWGDYDSDGYLDLFRSNWGGIDQLYKNNGNGTFTESVMASNIGYQHWSTMVAWADYDGDSDLDLYLTQGNPNLLYRNDGASTFTEVGASAGVANNADPMGIGWADYDGDGDLDIYLANAGSANRLYRNNGNSTFTDVAASAGVSTAGSGYTARGFGVAWGDYDGDSDLDLYLVNLGAANRLYRNNSNGTFTDITSSAGVTDGTNNHYGAAWADYDGDGDLDLYIANEGANSLFRNNGNSTFTNIATSAGVADLTGSGHGVAWGDYDGDGDLDLYVVHYGGPNVLFVNSLNPYNNTYLTVKVLSSTQKWTQSGVRVSLKTTNGGTHVATRIVDGGTGSSQSATPLYFYNLTPNTSYSLEVFWTDGSTSTHILGTPDGSSKRVCRSVAGLC